MLRVLYFAIICVHFFIVAWLGINKSRVNGKDARENKGRTVFIFLVIAICLLVAFRPKDIVPDAIGYYNRYTNAWKYASLYKIIHADSYYRGLEYSMSKPVNMIFYLFHQAHVPYELFVFVIAILEITVVFIFFRKICEELGLKYNEYILLLFLLLFYCYPYQFVAFSQGMGMIFLLPAFFYLQRRKYIRMAICVIAACSIHIGMFWIIPTFVIYKLTPKLKAEFYTFVWGVGGVLYFTGFSGRWGGYLLEETVSSVVGSVSEGASVYSVYGDTVQSQTSAMGTLIYLFIGCIIGVYINRREYWKICNVELLSFIIQSFLGQWPIFHRLTDVAWMLIPIEMLIYLYEAKTVFKIESVNLKKVILITFVLMEFIVRIRVLKLL